MPIAFELSELENGKEIPHVAIPKAEYDRLVAMDKALAEVIAEYRNSARMALDFGYRERYEERMMKVEALEHIRKGEAVSNDR